MNQKYWYAVCEGTENDGWDNGSYSLKEAKEIFLDCEYDKVPDALIAVIDVSDEDPMCVAEIRYDDFDYYGDQWSEVEHWQF